MSTNSLRSAPNIIFIMADDLGFNDVSWHNPDIYTPNLHNLGTIHIKFGLNYFDKDLEPRNDINKEMLYCRDLTKDTHSKNCRFFYYNIKYFFKQQGLE